LDDQAGHDGQFDFLVSTADTLSGGHPEPDLLMESDVAQPSPVLRISSEAVTVSGSLVSLEPVLQMTFSAPAVSGWYYVTANDPTNGSIPLVEVIRGDR